MLQKAKQQMSKEWKNKENRKTDGKNNNNSNNNLIFVKVLVKCFFHWFEVEIFRNLSMLYFTFINESESYILGIW